jgi:predicted MFS family arabinose efflux permease
LPAISRGLGLPLETTALLLTIRGLIGALSPFFGYLSDRLGRKTLMLAGLTAMVGGAALVSAGHTFGAVLVAFALLGFAKASYDPAMQAFISDAVPYQQRGKALGTIEYSWAGSWLIGVPLSGLLIARWDWHAPFLLIAVLGTITLIATARARIVLPRVGAGPAHAQSLSARPDLSALLTRSTLAALAVGGLVIFANEDFLVVYGAWMEKQFALDASRLGLLSVIVSVAELTGAAVTVWMLDRWGKRGGLLVGLAANVLAYLLLPLLAGRLAGAIVGVMFVACTAEFSIVSTLPLISEMAPRARGTLMAVNAALTSLAAALGSLVGPRLWEWGGLPSVSLVSGLGAALALVLLWASVREKPALAAAGGVPRRL